MRLVIPTIYKEHIGADGDPTRIDYQVHYPTLKDGSGRLEFTRISMYPLILQIYPHLKKEDWLAEITSFYPHGIMTDENYEERLKLHERNGIGGMLLEEMMQDASRSEIIFISTDRKKMKYLLKKYDFVSDGIVDVWYFKLMHDNKARTALPLAD